MLKFVCESCGRELPNWKADGSLKEGKFTCQPCIDLERSNKKRHQIVTFSEVEYTKNQVGEQVAVMVSCDFAKTAKQLSRLDATLNFNPPPLGEMFLKRAGCGWKPFHEKYRINDVGQTSPWNAVLAMQPPIEVWNRAMSDAAKDLKDFLRRAASAEKTINTLSVLGEELGFITAPEHLKFDLWYPLGCRNKGD